MIHIFPAVIIQFHLTNAFIPASIFRLRFNVYYSSIELQRIYERTRFSQFFFSFLNSKELGDATCFIAPVS